MKVVRAYIKIHYMALHFVFQTLQEMVAPAQSPPNIDPPGRVVSVWCVCVLSVREPLNPCFEILAKSSLSGAGDLPVRLGNGSERPYSWGTHSV